MIIKSDAGICKNIFKTAISNKRKNHSPEQSVDRSEIIDLPYQPHIYLLTYVIILAYTYGCGQELNISHVNHSYPHLPNNNNDLHHIICY